MRAAPAPDAPSLSNEAFVAGYEDLRRQALISPRGPGVVVLVRRGVQAWMSAFAAGGVPLSPERFTPTEAGPAIPQGLHTEIVLILVGMLLHGCQEALA
jgi:hypothetical protein